MVIVTIVVCVVLIGLDQLFKYLAVQYLISGPITVIPGVLELRYAENDGAAFSLLAGKQTLLIILTGLTLLVIGIVLIARRPKQKLEYISLLMIFSGGVGNLINRIAAGYVVDYLNVLFMNFAVFNFADCLVVVGVALFIVSIIMAEVKGHKEKKAAKLQPAAGGNDDGAGTATTASLDAQPRQKVPHEAGGGPAVPGEGMPDTQSAADVKQATANTAAARAPASSVAAEKTAPAVVKPAGSAANAATHTQK